MKLLFHVLFWTCLASAQVVVGNFGVNYVTTAPSGTCSKTALIQIVMGAGTAYTCQSGTWGQSGASTSPGSPTTSVQFNNAGAFAGSSNFTWDNVNGQLLILNAATGGFGQIRVSGTGAGSTGNVTMHSDGFDVNENMENYGNGNLAVNLSSTDTESDGNHADFASLYVRPSVAATSASVFDFNRSIYIDRPSVTLLTGGSLAENTGLYIADQHGLGAANSAITIADQSATGTAIKVNGGLNDLGPQATTLGSLKTATNCANGASPAVCAAAASGVVAVPTGTNPTLQINTSAVTASSRPFLQIDESATIGGVTCNTTLSTLVQPVMTARNPGVSFTIQIGAILAGNPACVSYFIVN